MITISGHAFDRAKQRLGLNASALKRFMDRAVNEGVSHAQTKGALNRYLNSLFLQHGKGNGTRIYGEHVFIIDGHTLITVLHLPHQFRRVVAKLQAANQTSKA